MRKSAKAVSGVASAAVALLIMMVGTPPAVADTGPVEEAYIDSVGIVHYPFDLATLPGARIVVQEGAASGGDGCVFSADGSHSPGSEPMLTVGQEVTYDPANCTREIAIASYPLSAVPASVSESLAPEEGWTEEVSSSSSEGALAARATEWYASLNARIQDPVGIHVSSTTTERTWSSTGAWSNQHHWGWYTPTGWSRLSNSQVDTSTVGDTLGTFQNVLFCNPFAATDTNHSRTRLTTNSAGGVTWGYTMNKSGDCAELLSYHYSLITP